MTDGGSPFPARPRIGISSCLMGNRVRYDGGHRLEACLIEILGRTFELVPVCPEVECGLSTPREAMRLAGDPKHVKLVTLQGNKDLTARMSGWASARIEGLRGQRLCGYVFKSRSPSCGLYPGHPIYGVWAKAVREAFPDLPVEEEVGLKEDAVLAAFVARAMAFRPG